MTKMMRLLDPHTGHMRCKECGSEHYASVQRGGGYRRGSWQCVNKCAPGIPRDANRLPEGAKMATTPKLTPTIEAFRRMAAR